MKNLNPLYLTEGAIGNNVRIIKAYQKMLRPNKGDPFLFNQNTKILRDRYAKRILDAGKPKSLERKKEHKKLINYTSNRVEKYIRDNGELPSDLLYNAFKRFPTNKRVIGTYSV